jgi:tetratricopeptide (TPR) repeat protein
MLQRLRGAIAIAPVPVAFARGVSPPQAAMTVSPDPAPLPPLVCAARPRRRIVRSMVWLAALGGVVAALRLARNGPDCTWAADTAPAAIAARVCEREYARTGDPIIGARLAEAHRVAGDLTAASAIARGLIATPARGDALRVLGEIALAQRRLAAALAAFERARALHQLDGQRAELSRDDAAIARVQRALSQHPPAAPR